MNVAVDRVVVLLGAGASADAGLPLTSALAQQIIERVNGNRRVSQFDHRSEWSRALNAVYGAMVGYRGAHGDNPLTAVNVETLISAVRLLQMRDKHEVAPFVAAWGPAVTDFGSFEPPHAAGSRIIDTVGRVIVSSHGGSGGAEVSKAVAEIAHAVLRPDTQESFADAEKFILRSLVELLGEPEDVGYLKPLIDLASRQRGGLDVITLNYDLTVEEAAHDAGIEINRGVETWTPGEAMEFPAHDGVLNLMKLHGSLDWRRSRTGRDLGALLTPWGIDVLGPGVSVKSIGDATDLPWIVVGDREKLATDGPTLILNAAARTALLRAGHLVVVGYSFGDAHINAMVRDWLAGDESRTVTVLDTNWPIERYWREFTDFRSALVGVYAREKRFDGTPQRPRMLPLQGTASESLGQALVQRPTPPPDPQVTVTCVEQEGWLRLDVTWHGIDIENVAMSAELLDATPHDPRRIPLLEEIPEDGTEPGGFGQVVLSRLRSGQTCSVFAPASTVLPFGIKVSGGSIAGARDASVTIQAAEEAQP